MRKLLFLLILTTIMGIHAYAQQYTKTSLTEGVHPGTITTLDGQVLKGYIINRDRQYNQKECVFYTDYTDSHTKKIYKPADIAGYTIENTQYKSINYSGNISFGKPDRHFVYIVQPGAITTFIYWANEEQPVWQKNNDEPVSNSSMLLSFKKSVLKLVGDDAELAAKIDSKEKGYGMLNIQQIVNEYNTWAESKKQ